MSCTKSGWKSVPQRPKLGGGCALDAAAIRLASPASNLLVGLKAMLGRLRHSAKAG